VRDVAFESHEVRVTIDGKPKVYRLNARKLAASERDSQNILLAFWTRRRRPDLAGEPTAKLKPCLYVLTIDRPSTGFA
jgi:hypothetical protein